MSSRDPPTTAARRPKAVVSWSSGKDCAFALSEIRREGEVEVVGLLTTVTETFGRVSMHGVRVELLRRQAEMLGLPLTTVPIPFPCPNDVYEQAMEQATAQLRADGISRVVFGDLFLEEIRSYREDRMKAAGLIPLFPLWGRDTRALANEMIGRGWRARLVCVDPRQLAGAFAGREFDESLLADLPPAVDPCGERGEFHTFVYAGPDFHAPIELATGPVVTRDGFVFADLTERRTIPVTPPR